MDSFSSCKFYAYSEEYADYILETGGNVREIEETFRPECIQMINENFVTIYENIDQSGNISFQRHGYGAVPKCFGLLDTSSVENTGAIRVRRQPDFDLFGTNVIIGFVDTGIDFTNPVFQNADGSSRILYIWDQSVEQAENENVPYGREYSEEEITEALQSDSPREIIPHQDVDYHGTFMAAIAAGNISEANNFTGVAPNAGIIMVKLKEAKENLREFYGIQSGIPCYQENDIMLGVEYLRRKARQMQRPLVICLGVGSNAGSHDGMMPLGSILNQLGSSEGICTVVAGGNENNLAHHYAGTLDGFSEEEVELDVEDNEDFTMELWTNALSFLSVGFISPTGEFTERIPIRSYEQAVDFVFERAKIYVYYERIEYYSGKELIAIRVKNPTKGIWRIRVYNLEDEFTNYHIWLPMREFISDKTLFIYPSPDVTLCEPGNVSRVITVAAFNHRNGSIFLESSRGYTANNSIKPDIAAPGVEVYGPVSSLRYGQRSGTSVAAAHTAGIAAMLLEWGIWEKNHFGMNTITCKYYLIKGARKENMATPNRSFGWGELDLYNTFASLRRY